MDPLDTPLERSSARAPTYNVPQDRLVSIEHPCIIRNLDNGIKSLGGEAQMKHVAESVGAWDVLILNAGNIGEPGEVARSSLLDLWGCYEVLLIRLTERDFSAFFEEIC